MRLAWEIAKETYEREAPGHSFNEFLSRYLGQGACVWSCPWVFVVACPVFIHPNGDLFHDPLLADTWYIHLAAISPNAPKKVRMPDAFMALAPYQLSYVAWQRRQPGVFKRYSWERLQQFCLKAERKHGQRNRYATAP